MLKFSGNLQLLLYISFYEEIPRYDRDDNSDFFTKASSFVSRQGSGVIFGSFFRRLVSMNMDSRFRGNDGREAEIDPGPE
jgi:hypothetical protein